MRERAVLVTVAFDSVRREYDLHDISDELEELCRSAGVSVAKSLVFNQKTMTAPFFIGKGKAEEIKAIVKEEAANVVVFEGNLSSTQQRNLEEMIQIKTIDRTQLILDIFAQRARSMEGKLQVELAQMKYLLPRLAGKGIYLSRLGGGVGTRGPGEQKLEMDRRRIRERIAKFTRELHQIEKRRIAGIQSKKEKNLPLIALVGYTNAGKSSLFNALTKGSEFVKDKLFSTLDTTTRLLNFPGNRRAFISDTVGFVRDLPHHLIESFKATLEEAVHADILLHVIDASRENVGDLEKAVNRVLKDLGANESKKILVLNKSDLVSAHKQEAMSRDPHWEKGVWVSSVTGKGLEGLLSRILMDFAEKLHQREIFIPKDKQELLHFLYEEAEVIGRRDEPEGVYLNTRLSGRIEGVLRGQLQAPKK